MKTRLLSLIPLMLLMMFTSVMAQTPAFKVLASKDCMVKDQAQWKAIVKGDKLPKMGELQVKPGGYLGLLHVSGKSIEIKKAGTYKVDELINQINTQQVAFSQKYANFALSKMTASNSDEESFNVTGAVTRSGGVKKNAITLIAPPSFKILNDSPVEIKWETGNTVKAPYLVIVEDQQKEKILSTETNQPSVMLDASRLSVSNTSGEINCEMMIQSKEAANVVSDPHQVTILSTQETKEIKQDIAELDKELNKTSPLDNLIYASYFEEKGLLLDAKKYYETAVKTGEGIDDYQDAYNQFLKRTNW